MVNTAMLTSRQVSEPLRVFVVTQAGKVADVTLQASCSSADESVLKVILFVCVCVSLCVCFSINKLFSFTGGRGKRNGGGDLATIIIA